MLGRCLDGVDEKVLRLGVGIVDGLGSLYLVCWVVISG